MRIGRWYQLSVDRVCQEHEVMRDADANETSEFSACLLYVFRDLWMECGVWLHLIDVCCFLICL